MSPQIQPPSPTLCPVNAGTARNLTNLSTL